MLTQDVYLNNWTPFTVNKIDAENKLFQLKKDDQTFDLKFIDKNIILDYPDKELEMEINILLSMVKFNSFTYQKIRDILGRYFINNKKTQENNEKIPELFLNQEKIYYKYPLDKTKLYSESIPNKIKDIIYYEMKQINTNKKYPHFIVPKTLTKFKINILDDNNNKIILAVEIDDSTYPYSPPMITWEYPRIPLKKLSQFYGCEIFSKKWNPVITLEWLITEFNLQFVNNDFFGYNSKFSIQEQLFTQLFSLNNMFSTDKPLKLNYTPLEKLDKSRYWKSGTGYGHSSASNWSLEEYLKDSNLINQRTTNILQRIKNHLDNLDNDFQDKFYNFLNNEITGLNLLELEKKLDYYLELFSIILLVDKTKIPNLATFIKESKDSLSLIPIDKYPSYLNKLLPIIEQFGDLHINQQDTLVMMDYEKVMKEIQFEYYDVTKAKYKYVNKSGKPTSSKQMIRLAQDLSSLKKSLPLNKESTIWVRWDKNNMTKMQFIISGPKDTPYQDGLFLFDCYFPSDYPSSPPIITLQTTGGGSVRFNPNLYNNGKVCLSLLGTWSGQGGEKWNAKTSTLLQVLVSIQSLILIEEPYFNEPGYEREIGTPSGKTKSFNYNDKIRKETLRWAVIDMIKNPPFGFEEVVKKHFESKMDDINQLSLKWLEETKKYQEEYLKLNKQLI